MDLSRTQKNRILIAVNIAFAILIAYAINFSQISLGKYLSIWIVSCPIVIIAHLIPTQNRSFLKIRDVGLFLLTGGAIGTTIGNIIKQDSVHLLFIVWLIAAIIAAIFHYSPSKNDRYMN